MSTLTSPPSTRPDTPEALLGRLGCGVTAAAILVELLDGQPCTRHGRPLRITAELTAAGEVLVTATRTRGHDAPATDREPASSFAVRFVAVPA